MTRFIRARVQPPGAVLVLLGMTAIASAQYIQQTIAPTPFQANASGGLTGQVGDLDNNGLPDVVYFDGYSQFHVMVNPGLNGITTATTYSTTPAIPFANAWTGGGGMTDFNGDGNLDVPVLVGTSQTPQIYIWSGNGDGTLALPPVGPLPVNNVRRFFVGDLHGDGVDDIVVHRQFPAGTGVHELVLLGNSGERWIPWSHQVSSFPIMTTGDFDGDRRLDVAWAAPNDPLIYVAYGTGTGALLPELAVNPGSIVAGQVIHGGFYAPYVLGSSDLDGDGLDDLMVALAYGSCPGTPPSQLKRLYGTPVRGTFVDGGDTLPLGMCGGYLSLAGDWDLDGITDLMIYRPLYFSSGHVELRFHLMRGLGNRVFDNTAMSYVIPFLPVPQSMALDPLTGDFDGDGDLDMIGTPAVYTTYFENRAIFGQGCYGTTGIPPVISIDPPTLGNTSFGISLSVAAPASPAVLAVSLVRSVAPAPCGPLIDLGFQNLLLPQGTFGFVTTSAAGTARVAIPLPSGPAFQGVTVFAQWAVADPQGGSTGPTPGLALSRGRTIILW